MTTLDDDIDTEELQARLDMSMSVAQGVVTSWLKPKGLKSKRLSAFNEAELQTLLHRPPHLGVGAPLPDSASASSIRDALQLRHKLDDKKKKRARDDDNADHAALGESDEEESRAGAIRKKLKVDPFAMPVGKVKKAKLIAAGDAPAIPPPATDANPNTNEVELSGKVAAKQTDSLTSPSPLSPLGRKKKKKGKGLFETISSSKQSKSPRASPSSSTNPAASVSAGTLEGQNRELSLDASTGTSASQSSPAPQLSSHAKFITEASPNTSQAIDKLHELAPGTPLLNLAGPPVDNHSPNANPTITSKKKRRKKKKSKNKHTAELGELQSTVNDPRGGLGNESDRE